MKLKQYLTLFLLLLGTAAWGETKTSTLTFTKACGGSGTANDGALWTVTSDAKESTFDNTKGIHYGTSNAAVSYLQLTTSDISGTISKIVVKASGASGTSAKLNVTVGNNTFGSEVNLTSSSESYTFTGANSGEICVRLSQNSAKKALYVKSIEVTYSEDVYTVTPISNNSEWGTVSLSGTIITASPADGYRVSTTAPYTVINGNVTVTQSSEDNNLFYVLASSDCTVQINFEKIPTITATSNNTSFGTVSVSGNIITASPNAFCQVSENTPYTVTSGEATVIQSGNTFTVTATADCTIQINFEEIPVETNIFVKSDSAPYIYTWKGPEGSETKYSGDWPGTQMSDTWPDENGVTWYKASIRAKGFNMILNNGNGSQTPDINNITEDTYFEWYGGNGYQVVQLAEVIANNLQVNAGATENCNVTTNPEEGLTLNYSSNNPSIATVSTDGTVTGVSEGTATITVSWNTQEVDGTYYAGGSKTFTVTVNEVGKERTYQKITSEDDIEDGKKYLIVYEGVSVAFDGSLEVLDKAYNKYGVTITNNIIKTNADIYFIINGNTIQSASGYYIGRTANSNGLNSSNSIHYNNSIRFSESGNVRIIGEGGPSLMFNSTNGDMRFRYYASHNQKPIQLYKEVNPKVKIYVKSDEAPFIYTWTGDGDTATKYTGNWPGTQTIDTEEVNGVTWYTMTVPAKGFNLILNNGNSGESNQTADINNITEDTYYVWNSAADGYSGANNYLPVKFANVSASNVTVREGNTAEISVSKKPEGLSLSYSSNDETVATVTNDGTVTGVAAGTATITVSWATQVVGGQGYLGGSINYTVTVQAAPSSDVFVKATSIADLEDGMEVIIVNDTYNNVMGEQHDNNFAAITVDINEGRTEATPYEGSTVTVLTLVKSGEYWYFKDEHGKYLYAASSSNNYLRTEEEPDDNAKAEITISGENSDASIVFKGTNARNTIRYNGSKNGEGLFSCYASGQNPVQIYYREAQDIIARPTITPAAGTYTEAQEVTIMNHAEGATVYYTTDGTTPTTSSTVYENPFTLSKNGTYVIKAIASNGEQSSSVSTVRIVIQIPIEAPVILPDNGTQITEATDISISCSDTSLSIYYTTDGTDPVDDHGNLTGTAKAYTEAFHMSKACTVKAVTLDATGNASTIVSATYTYNGTVTLPYYERFDAGLGNFISIGTDDLKWRFRSHTPTPEFLAKYGEERKYAYASNGSNHQTVSGTTRLVSPIVDLTAEGLSTVIFNFIHAGRYFSSEAVMKATCRVQIITDDNDRDLASTDVLSVGDNWTDLTIPDDGWFDYTSESFPRKNSGDISLEEYIGKKVRICFLFDATNENNYGTWNVDQISIRGELVEKVTIPQPEGATGEGYASYVLKNDIDAEKTLNEKGVKLYKVVEFDRQNVVLVQLGLGTGTMGENTYSEKVVPAESPVLIKAGFGEKELVLVNSQEVVPKLRGNLLRSAVDGVTATKDDRFFVLQHPKSVGAYGFFLLGTGKKIEGRKSYLNGVDEVEQVTIQNDAKQGIFFFGEEDFLSTPTCIDNLELTPAGAPNGVYDLTGRKIADVKEGLRLPKGIYVVNGKKMVVK